MGINCSNLDKDDSSSEKDVPTLAARGYSGPPSSQLIMSKSPINQPFKPASPKVQTRSHTSTSIHFEDIQASRIMLTAQHDANNARIASIGLDPRSLEPTPIGHFSSPDQYRKARDAIRAWEGALAFDFRATQMALPKERYTNLIIQRLRLRDKHEIYNKAKPRLGHHGQKHDRFPGDHFLSDVELIERTDLYQVAKMMPKGAHLHIHFNCCLQPNFLLDVAKQQPRMFVRSDMPLPPDDPLAFDQCEIQFSLLAEGEEDVGDIFDSAYIPGKDMLYQDFLDRFPGKAKVDPEQWLQGKLMFTTEETHNLDSAWEKFNGRTRMMKGLFNYEEAFRQYTRAVLQDFVKDNIQYAEIRPNFMASNILKRRDGSVQDGNRRTVEIIIEEYERFQEDKTNGYFAGLKIIYCTPRSFANDKIRDALKECLEFKKEWPKWIAGFDLVGEEGRGRPLRDFVPELLQFRKNCDDAKLDIPFLFHCGETLEIGTDTDGNILDALLLNSKRIGHGFALARHPYIMERMKERNICLEVCPISNEVLGLTPRINGHSMYNLLANNVHCTVSSDNGTIFRSTLSHDFYQVMVGKADMTLHGWRQLIEWSLEHSCMEDDLRAEAEDKWKTLWEKFLDDVIEKYEWVLGWQPGKPDPEQHSEREREKALYWRDGKGR